MNIPVISFAAVISLLVLLAIILAWRATHDSQSKFDFEEAFQDDATGKTSMSRIGQFTALVASTAGFVYFILDNDMTEWYFGVYMSAWVLNSLGHKWLSSDPQKDQSGGILK